MPTKPAPPGKIDQDAMLRTHELVEPEAAGERARQQHRADR